MQGDKQAYAESSSLTLRKQRRVTCCPAPPIGAADRPPPGPPASRRAVPASPFRSPPCCEPGRRLCRHAAVSESGAATVHRAHIEQLKKDNDALKHELALETRSVVKMNSSAQASKVASLQDEADLYTRKIEMERRRIDELTKQIKIMQAKILDERRALGGFNASRENNAQVAKQIKILENRLDKALVKFNEALAHNKQLRETIDNLRRERVVFDGIYKKLEKELQEKKKEIASIVEMANIGELMHIPSPCLVSIAPAPPSATRQIHTCGASVQRLTCKSVVFTAYEARDQAQAEMAALKAQAEKEEASFETEWKDLTRMIEEDRKKKEKSDKKNARGEMSMDQEAKLRKKVIAGNWNIAKDKAQQAATAERVQSYEEAFEKIKAATEINDIDELVTTFCEAEEKNFSLFNFVNELNSEIEKLEEQISALKSDVESFKSQGGSQENQRRKIVSELEEKLQKTIARADMYEEKHVQTQKTLGALKTGIQSIFDKIGCRDLISSEAISEQGDQSIGALGIIEERTNQILSGAVETVDGQLVPMVGLGPQTPAGAIHLNVNPPTTGDDFSSDDESDDEDEDRPLTREELKARTMRRLNKRDSKPRGGARGRKGR